jgi:magnesium transporter
MIHFFGLDDQGLKLEALLGDSWIDAALWIDLLSPTAHEESLVERSLGIEVPTREEMREIETSNRLYEENGVLYLTATVVTELDTEHPQNNPITFILTPRQLVTNRYVDPLPFKRFKAFAVRHGDHCASPGAILAGLLETFVNRIADALERTSDDIDHLAADVFTPLDSHRAQRVRDYRKILERVGRNGDLNSKARETLTSLARLIVFLQQSTHPQLNDAVRARLRIIFRDLHQMSDHASFLASKVQFTLDATLGLINIEQNNTLKIFSVVTVLLLPPSVIAAAYGMNFRHLPGIEHPWGFAFIAMLMLVSAILPFALFRRRGWL